MGRRLPKGNVPMTSEPHRRLALELRLAAEALIGAPSPESYNTLSKMLAALNRAGLKLPAVDDATMTMNLICDRFERVGKVGVSADEATALRGALARIDGGMWRIPVNLLAEAIVDMTKLEVFAYCAQRGTKPNPLYLEDCDRVGCAPCINSKKKEIHAHSRRRPHHIIRIGGWERIVSMASKRGYSTFFHKVDDQAGTAPSRIYQRNEVWQVVEWAQTTRGGRQFSLLSNLDEPTGCSSSYGLCDQG